MNRLRTGVVLLLAASGLAGCFDVHSAPGALLIDDFESGDLLPFDPGFGKWGCQGISTEATDIISCDVDTDTLDHSAGAYLSMTVTDPSNGGLQDHVGASLETGATMGPVDFTRYQRLTFDIRLVSAMPALPADALVYLELGCDGAAPESGAALNNLYVLQGVAYQAFWETDSLTMDNFGPPPWLKTPIQGGTEACLRQVTAVRFSIDSQLADGSTGSAVLYIDNVALQ